MLQVMQHVQQVLRRHQGALPQLQLVVVPEVVPELSTGRVLCMEYLHGVPILEADYLHPVGSCGGDWGLKSWGGGWSTCTGCPSLRPTTCTR